MSTRTFSGRYESLARIAEFVRLEAKEAGLSFKEIFELETAVDEAVSNIIEHAYGGEGIGEIICTTAAVTGGIQIILEDFGQPFDPSGVPVPELNSQLKYRKNHGLGYFLMCQLVDDVNFVFTEDHNKLTLLKKHQQ